MTNNLTLRVQVRYLNRLDLNINLPANKWVDHGLPPDENSTEYLTVFDLPFNVITNYGRDVAWLEDLAKSLFGREVARNAYGEIWDTGNGTRPNLQTPLAATIYEYRPQAEKPIVGNPVFTVQRSPYMFSLARFYPDKLPQLQGKVKSRGDFANKVKERDTRCVISNTIFDLVASHLIPHALPHEAIMMILDRHSLGEIIDIEAAEANNDLQIGITVFSTLDKMVDNFTLGFYCPDPYNHPRTYEVHVFDPSPGDYNVLGMTHAVFATVPGAGAAPLANLHGHVVTFDNLPRPFHAAFRWHYMQCVMRNLTPALVNAWIVW